MELYSSGFLKRTHDLRDAFSGFNASCYDNIEAVVFRVLPIVEFAEKAEREAGRR